MFGHQRHRTDKLVSHAPQLRRHGFAVAPIAVGLILGEMVETNLQNSLKMFDGAWWQIFTQPLAALFLVFAALGLFGSPVLAWRTRLRRGR